MTNQFRPDSPTSMRVRFLETLLESATDYAIIAMDLDGLVTVWNEGARRILGWTEEEMLGQPASIFFTPEDRRAGIPQAEMQAALTKNRGSDERWHQKKDGTCFWASGEMMPLKDEAATNQGFLKILRDRTEKREDEERQRFLMRELEHRVKNTLAVVLAISSQTFRGNVPLSEARNAFNARLMTLSRAHDVLMQGSWTEAKLRALVEDAARMHRSEDRQRFHIDGPEITIGPKAALSFALVLHELATNAAKYGALSVPEGRVSVTWQLEEQEHPVRLQFCWQETDGPAVSLPEKRGFGSRLIEQSLSQEPESTVLLSYPSSGVVLTLDAPLGSLQKS